jgi:DNA/RNA-binding domain of Phe-tRNA-synthetase-like protein
MIMPETDNVLNVTENWQKLYPGARAGVLVMSTTTNPVGHPALDARRLQAEESLRQRFTGLDRSALLALPVQQAYTAYYRRFKKTYHVLLQVESIAFKGRPIPNVEGLVQAMFIAELENMLLTAGHDLDLIELPLTLDTAAGGESYTGFNGQEQILKAGDMFIACQQGIISSVLSGPDARTRITSATRRAVYTVYAPPGIEEVLLHHHLESIRASVLLFDPQAECEGEYIR